MQRRFHPLFFIAAGGLALSSCQFQGPLNGGNALDPPGFGDQFGSQAGDLAAAAFAPGDWVETSTQSAALYDRFPGIGDQPVRTLSLGTPLKVVSSQGTYAKVELESGSIGFVPEVMLSKKGAASGVPGAPTGLPPLSPYGETAPEPEIAPISVEDVNGGPPSQPIDPAADNIE
jgi:hypothetical protein